MKNKIIKSLAALVVTNLLFSVAMASYELQWPNTTSPQEVQLSHYDGSDDFEADYYHAQNKTSDGKYMVFWGVTNYNTDESKVIGVKVQADGTVGDPGSGWTGEKVIDTLDPGEFVVTDVVPADNGSVFLAYYDLYNTEMAFLAKVGADGNVISKIQLNDGVPGFLSLETHMISDGSGGVYYQFETDDDNYNTGIGHFTSSLAVAPGWTGSVGTYNIVVDGHPGSFSSPHTSITRKTNGHLILLTADADSGGSLSLTEVDGNGNYAGLSSIGTPHVPFSDAQGNIFKSYNYDVSADSANGFFIDYVVFGFGLQMNHFDSSGNKTWAADGLSVDSLNNSGYARLIADNSGNAYIMWYHDYNSDATVRVQKYNSAGTALWPLSSPASEGIDVSPVGVFAQTTRKSENVVLDGNGGMIVAYNDSFSDNAVRLQRILSDGTFDWGSDGVKFGGGAGTEDIQSYDAGLTTTGITGEVVAFWKGSPGFIFDPPFNFFGQFFRSGVSGGGGGGAGADTNGTETVNCNTAGAIALSAATGAVTFQARTTNFFNDSTDAPLTSALNIDVSDTRGYDPGAGNCGGPSTLSIQSSGLTSGAVTLNLDLGTALTTTAFSCTGACVPTTLDDVVTATGNTGSITLGSNLVNFAEAFDGVIRTSLTGVNLEVTRPAQAIPTGTYTGTITFTLS